MATFDPEIGKQIIALKAQIVSKFDDSNWRELGVLTGHLDEVEEHPRLLRSLTFGDGDYDGCALNMLQKMVAANSSNLGVIREYVQDKCIEAGDYISSEESKTRRIVFSPNVFRVPDGDVDSRLVSVMMPFSDNFNAVYDSIKLAATGAGLTCRRVDDIWDDSTVIQDIFSLIFLSHIVVCDFSDRNPNVFYEAGIAHTLGKHVIPITQSEDDVPFDLRHHRHVRYLNNSEGRRDLEGKLLGRFRTLVNKLSTPPGQ